MKKKDDKPVSPAANANQTAVIEVQLLPDEKVAFFDAREKNSATDEELNARYAKGEIRIVTESARYSLAGILSMLQEEVEVEGEGVEPGTTEPRYKLDPEYQRRHRWSDERKSRLIESFLMNVPVPPVFLYERDLARFEVMDGRQRLTALSDFYDDKFSLCGLEYWADLEGRTYSNIPKKVRDGIDRRYISSIILLKETASSDEQAALLKKIVFERLNSGGVELSSQETRNAIYNGPLNKLCMSLSENQTFRRLWGIPSGMAANDMPDDELLESGDVSTLIGRRMFEKMEDVELVLRFFAYRQISSFRAGLNKISEFLDRFLFKGNSFESHVLVSYRELFESSIEFLFSALGSDAFTAIGQSQRPTKIVYDPIMYVSNDMAVRSKYAELVSSKEILKEELVAAYATHAQLFSGRKTNYSDTQARNQVIRAAFLKAISRI
ncbi:DUF262 domain-containing protein [Pseudomonas carnis]|uniref:DUF262 domain-containing protein n=1 Tax=Pseudomonas carnis TaxID=2487355 RepID=UPI001E170C76|nr:DUF262 domain-containing protein [Pseudomonas carnis]CAH0272980.1 hypothetical protein SRABI111_03730 [Pseudomonas carnis]CAH0323075.1 hypothetical protein SRABI08_05610 [Pseudomonas carnis]CAH0324608.1 hypothetical protein SRABI110_05976 [Pseudomonas carnis]CAH0325717.1 hypothetical protein SRABI64_05998 [Pseudomonas carnis]